LHRGLVGNTHGIDHPSAEGRAIVMALIAGNETQLFQVRP
jgi:hypothetical protein